MWAPVNGFRAGHISLAESADLIVIAPATANTIAHLACGMTDDLLTATVLATKAPVILFPAMNDNMFSNPVTQENISRLRDRGFVIGEPGYGKLASGKLGKGRLPDTGEILEVIRHVLARNGELSGKNIVITAGGTREPVDPVRFIGNRSSGKTGFALAQAARDRGAEVKLITTMPFASSAGIEVISVDTAAGMKEAVEKAGPMSLLWRRRWPITGPKALPVIKLKRRVRALSLSSLKTPIFWRV
jgi:phosphopantothenoylcysteine decarboxylase/phosphopantothenate--cysteine ligase